MSLLDLNEGDWAAQKQAYKERVRTIVIPLDVTPGGGKGILSRIDAFFSEIRIELGELEEQKEMVESIIREWERTKISGTNDLIRKKNASEALQNYPVAEGETLNLYDLQRKINSKVAFLNSMIDTLNGKQARLITVSGLLKLEKELLPYADIGMDAGRR